MGEKDITLGCQWPKNRVSCLRRHCDSSRNGCKGFTVKSTDRIGLQNLEFDAVQEMAVQWRRLSMTAVVDDDYPEVRHDYEGAMSGLMRALKANGRTL